MRRMYFPTTHWSLLAEASLNGETNARSALDELCRRYWEPLRRFIRARGYSPAEAEDLTQGFFLHLLDKEAFRKPDRLRGKFRSFLLGALVKYLSHERERALAQKRGGQQSHLSVDLIEESEGLSLPTEERGIAAFDRAWALTTVRAALEHVQRDYARAGKEALFGVLREFLPGAQATPRYDEAAARVSMSLPAFNSESHRFRQQFRDALRAEVMATVSAPHEIQEEITHLYRVLMDRGTDFGPARES